MAYGKIKADTLVYDNSGSDTEVTISSLGNKADLASPTFTGTVTIPTPSSGDNSTKAASTAFVVDGFAPKASPTFTGTINGAALTLTGNLTVQGTTTTISSTTIDVVDKNIELGKVSSPDDTTAQGGGITLKGATDKEWSWGSQHGTGGSWISNQNIFVGDNKSFIAGAGDDISMYHDSANAGSRIKNITGELHIINTTSNSIKLKTNNADRLTIDGTGAATFTGTVSDSKGDVRSIPQLSKSSKHTIVLADAGKHSINSSGGWEFDTSTAFTAGMAITLINNSGSDQTVEADGVTLYNTADAATGNRTLAGRGMATVICTASNTYYISGAGLS